VLDYKVDVKSESGRGSHFSVEAPLTSALPGSETTRERPRSDPGQLAGMALLCIDNDAQILDGMEALLGGWGCRVLKAPDLDAAIAIVRERKTAPAGLLVDYHLDHGNGIEAIGELRRRYGSDLPAILITADRSPHVHGDARAHDVQVLYKPLKPASLRALIAQWRVQRVAAAE
jgi:CheY-like chemotaxis protein